MRAASTICGGRPFRCEPPRAFGASWAATLGSAVDGRLSDPKKIAVELRANWGHVSAQQLKRVFAGWGADNVRLVNDVAEVLGRRAFNKAPHVPLSGTPAVSAFHEKFQVDSTFLNDLIASHAMDVFSEYSPSILARPKNLKEVRDAFCGASVRVRG